ncbi:MAG: competence/damage-inducible protein A [Bacilli bacterium]
MKSVEIIAVGTELLLGNIANTNAQYLSEELATLGFHVYYHTVVGDNRDRLRQAIDIAASRADVLLFTGGLGPTQDDVTKATVAEWAGTELEIHRPALDYIVSWHQERNRYMPPSNERQALVVKGCEVLHNAHGLAPGMFGFANGCAYILLPGPPFEMKPMFNNEAVPHLRKLLPVQTPIESRMLRFFGIGESLLEEKLLHLIEAQSNPTIAPYAKRDEVHVRLSCQHHDAEQRKQLLDACEAEVFGVIGEYCYGRDEETLFSVLVDALKKQELTLGAAESLTGGRFAAEMTSFPGVSALFYGSAVVYRTESKHELLGVSRDVLAQHGVVSEETVIQMAKCASYQFDSEIGIAFTGVAGPSDQDGVPVGTVWIGLHDRTRGVSRTQLLDLKGTRARIQERAVKHGAQVLLNYVQSLE